jgi:cytidylate kinase
MIATGHANAGKGLVRYPIRRLHMSVVTIRGQLGSGAPEIGRQVAEKLRVDYVDREIIAEVAARLQREEHDVIAKEMPPGTLLGRIAEALTSGYAGDAFGGGAYLPPELIPLGDARYVKALESVVRGLARGPSLVIRGRGSQFILKEHPGSLHVLVVAPLEVRVERVVQDLKLDQEAAHQEIARFDTSRREFIKRYFQAELEDPLQYDLVINTGRLSFETAASNIINAFRSRTRTGRKKAITG